MKKKFNFNIDKLKVCVIAENDSLFEQLSKVEPNKKHGTYIEELEDFNIKELGFKIHLLAKYEDEVKVKIGKEKKLTTFVKRIVMSIEDMKLKQQIGKLTLGACKGEISGFFEFSNRALYQKNVWNHILSSLHLKLVSLTTIEVALDLNFDFTRKLMKFIRDAENYDMILNRKKIETANAPLKNVYSISQMSRASISRQKTLYLGNEKKTLKMKSYNKSKEIEDGHGEKKYIEEWNNFGSSSKMFRVEFTIGWEFFYYEWLSSKGNGKGEDEPFSAYLGRIVDLLRSPMYKLSLWNFCANRQLYFRDKRTGEKLTLLKIATGIKNSQDLNRWIEEHIPTVFIFLLSMTLRHGTALEAI